MPVVYRLVKQRHAATAFSGEGAAKFGGRWNSRGSRLVYTSASRSLAALETLVHIDRGIPFEWVMFHCEIPDALIERVPASTLPAGWRDEPPTGQSQSIGDRWLRGGGTAVLAVPSVVIPEEWNYLLNPIHDDFRKLKPSAAQPFAFDSRLLAG